MQDERRRVEVDLDAGFQWRFVVGVLSMVDDELADDGRLPSGTRPKATILIARSRR